MTPLYEDRVLGIDAGGTKTLALLANRFQPFDDDPQGTGQSGPGNVRAVGFAAATREITSAIHAAFADANLVPGQVDAICLSVAGAGRTAEQQQLKSWAEAQNFARRVIVTTDAEPILAAAAPDGIGIAVISGTGSLAWGRNHSGQVARAGGWGYLFGDEGSGYAIAIAGLRAVAQSADGISPATTLSDAFLVRLNVAHPTDLIDRIYGTAMSRQQIAGLADIVFTAASHDLTARRILNVAAEDLANMITTLIQKLNFDDVQFPLAAAGGVLIQQPAFRAAVVSKIGHDRINVVSVTYPAVGAVNIARHQRGLPQ